MSGFAEMLTAMAVLVAASGAPLPRDGSLTSRTVVAHAPDPGSAGLVAERLRSAGFEVGPTVGVAFSVTGEPALFERYFGHGVEVNAAGEAFFSTPSGPTQELPAAEMTAGRGLGLQLLAFSPAYSLDAP